MTNKYPRAVYYYVVGWCSSGKTVTITPNKSWTIVGVRAEQSRLYIQVKP